MPKTLSVEMDGNGSDGKSIGAMMMVAMMTTIVEQKSIEFFESIESIEIYRTLDLSSQ